MSSGPPGQRPSSGALGEYARQPRLLVLRQLQSSPRGLTEADAQERLARHGDNAAVVAHAPHWAVRLLRTARDPFALVLLLLDAVCAIAGDLATTALIGFLVAVSCLLRFGQERRSAAATAALAAVAAATATVSRRAAPGAAPFSREVPVDQLVPGDIVELGPGDVVPADLRVLRSAGLAVSQAALTGETRPASKYPADQPDPDRALLDCAWMCLAGSVVVSGSGWGVVVATGPWTYLGAAASGPPLAAASFETGASRVSRTLLGFVLLSVVLVLAVGATAHGQVAQAFLVMVSVAVGLTPEMLPVVVTAALTQGARAMARLDVIVKSLPAVHNLGAIDVLCTDKTGTLTDGGMALECWVDPAGRTDPAVLRWACLSSLWLADHAAGQVADPMDEALLKQAARLGLGGDEEFAAAEVIPFDPARRCATVRLRPGPLRPGPLRPAGPAGDQLVITKGAVPEVLDRCGWIGAAAGREVLGPAERARLARLADGYAGQGIRLLAVATAQGQATRLSLAGFVGFRDEVRASAAAALGALASSGVQVKVITGDHPLVAARVCRDVGVDPSPMLTGAELDQVSDAALAGLASRAVLFAQVRPEQKARIVRALRAAGHTVGYLGDGLNDAAALRAADVGVSADGAVAAARESAQVILARKDLSVLHDAVLRGRRTFGNIIKYLKITVSSNAGNVASMLAASAMLPFLPMLPVQVLVQNVCFDLSQLGIAFDRVEESATARPRSFDRADLIRFVACFGLLNMLADLATFAVLWRLGGVHSGPSGPATFRTGWFTENLLTQALAVLLLRSRTGPGPRDWPAWPVLLGAAVVTGTALLLPVSPLAPAVGMHPLPLAFFPALAAVLAGYVVLVLGGRAVYQRVSPCWL